MKCSCPDGAYCCKHLAAVMYGVGARLDKQPELLFVLRDVDHQELVSQAVAEGNLDRELSGGDGALAGEDLGAMFGIELDTAPLPTPTKSKPKRALIPKTPASKTSAAKKPVSKKTATKRSTDSKKVVAKKATKKAAAKSRTKTANAKLSARKIAG